MRLMKGRSGSIGLLAMLCAAGCGGGQQGGAASATPHTSKAGDAVVTYFGQPKPLEAASSNAVTVLSQAGATFTNVTMQPVPNLADTYFSFCRSEEGVGTINVMPYGSDSSQLIYQSPLGGISPAVSAYGTIMFMLTNGPGFVTGQVDTIHPDGTGLKSVSFSNGTAFFPAYSDDGTNRVAYIGAAFQGLWVAPGTGGTAAEIQTDADGGGAAWSPSGTQIAYIVAAGTAGNTDVYVTGTSGGTPTDITPTTLKNTGYFSNPAWSPDGMTIAVAYQPSGSGVAEIVKFSPTSPVTYQDITPSGDTDESPAFSPDGTKLAFYRWNTNGAQPGLYVADAGGATQYLILPDPSNDPNSFNGFGWSPFLPKETVVAASGSTFYHQASSGWLLSETANQFGSFVAFTANTPSSATVTPATPGSGGAAPLVFTIAADAITQIGYINNYFNSGTTLTLSSTPMVVVSIDATSGQVQLVAPAAAKATGRTSGANVVYSGKFRALYDGKGTNLAPSGASEITVDPKSGKLVSFR